MTEISFFAGELLFTVIWLIVRTAVCIKEKHFDIKREALHMLMYINLAVIIRFIFYPFDTIDGKVQPLIFEPDRMFPLRVNLVPLVHITEYGSTRDAVINIAGNAGMFVPSGIIIPILYKDIDTVGKVTAAGALISLCIEIIQLPFAVRASDVDDIIMNTAGCFLGALIYFLVKRVSAKKHNA